MKLTDEQVIAALEAEEVQAQDAVSGELSQQRQDALARYKGDPLGNEVEGRSQVVDRSVMDTIEWIIPSLVRIYLGGDEIGKFEARGPEDEEAAKTETDVCNWYLETKNDIFSQINAVLRDALLLKNGYMVGQWVKKYDTMTETYTGLADEEVAILMQDKEVKVVEHTQYPDPSYAQMGDMGGIPMLHDVKVERNACEEYVGVESLPPDEVLVSKRHRWTSLMDCDFVEIVRRNVTIGQLRAEGFKIEDDEPGYDSASLESTTRDRFSTGVDFTGFREESIDPSRRLVTFRDAYMRMDMRGEGTPQLWRFCRVSGSSRLALKEEADIIPIAAFSPLVYPHSHIGTSVYDLIADISVIRTTLQRQLLDGIYLQNAGRVAVDVNRVNLDDLLVSRPGGIVRVDGAIGDSFMPVVTPDVSPGILGALEFMEGQKEGRTGVTRYSAGLDANSLNKTATGVQAIQAAANQRIELIARTLAGGFKDLFLIIHALACKHSTKPIQIKLKGKWVPVNPREWTRRTDFAISVGLGTGTPDQQLQKLLGLSTVFQQGMQMGLAGPQEAFNFGAEIWKAAGYRNPDRFMHEPQTDPQTGQPTMPPPPKDPLVQAEEVKGQVAMQTAQMKAQADGQKFQAQAAIDEKKLMADIALEREKLQADIQRESEKLRLQYEFEMAKLQMELAAEKEIEMYKADVQMGVAKISRPEPDEEDKAKGEEHNKMVVDALTQIYQLAEKAARPKKRVLVRDKMGRAEAAIEVED
jgi:hypothetical protein